MTKEIYVDASNVNGLGSKNVSKSIIDRLVEDGYCINVLKFKGRGRGRKLKLIVNRFVVSAVSIGKKVLVLGDYPLPFKVRQIVFIQQALLVTPARLLLKHKMLSQILNNIYFSLFSNGAAFYIFQSEYLRVACIEKYNLKAENCYVIRFAHPQMTDKLNDNHRKVKGVGGCDLGYYLSLTSDFWYKNNVELVEFWESVIGPKLGVKLKITLDQSEFSKFKYVDFIGRVPAPLVFDILEGANGVVSNSSIESLFLPAFESSIFDKPLFARYIPVLPEYFGESIGYFNEINELDSLIRNNELGLCGSPNLSIDTSDFDILCNIIKKR